MKGDDAIKVFYDRISEAFKTGTLVKLTLGKRKARNQDLKNIYARMVVIRDEEFLSFTFHFTKKDEVRNFSLQEGLELINEYIGRSFLQAYLFTTVRDYELLFNRRFIPALREYGPRFRDEPDKSHDREKRRLVVPEKSGYLYDLGIVDGQGKVRASMNDKFRQINKYIEIIDPLIKKTSPQGRIKIVDMGSGKGYLTFALYDYLVKQEDLEVEMLGIDQKKDLVELCNAICVKSGFSNLVFKVGRIEEIADLAADILIALHACDTATDEAIYRGIRAGASIILCAPCCHKEISRQIDKSFPGQPIIQYGILKERQAELITDTIRALLLEANGYDTNVFEFVSTEHTPKNIMISAVKRKGVISREYYNEKLNEIENIKGQFGIRSQYLEYLLRSNDD